MPSYTVLEITETEAKVLVTQKQKKKDLTVLHAIRLDFAGLSNDLDGYIQRGTMLRDALKPLKIPAGTTGLLIPKQDAIVRTVVLPWSDPEELGEMAMFEAEKFIPFNIERHIISNAVLTMDQMQGCETLITAIDGPVMDNLVAAANAATIEPRVAEVTCLGLVRAFVETAPDQPENTVSILLSIGTDQTEVTVLRGDLIATCRSQSLGTDKLISSLREAMHLDREILPEELATLDLTAPDSFIVEGGSTSEDENNPGSTRVGNQVRDWLNRTIRFIRQTFEFAVREKGITPAQNIYICGEATTLQGLSDVVAEMTSLPVHLFDPLASVPPSGNGKVDPQVLRGLAGAYGTVLRLVEEDEDPKMQGARINLLPLEIIELQEASERKMLLMISGTMLIITMILLYLAWDAQAAHAERLSDRYTKYNRQLAEPIERLAEKSEQLGIINKITANRTPGMYILDQISTFPGIGSTIDGGVLVVTEYRYSTREDVRISGMAVNFADMQNFADFLEKLTYQDKAVFKSVGLPQPTPRPLSANRGTVYQFEITAVLNTFDEEEEE